MEIRRSLEDLESGQMLDIPGIDEPVKGAVDKQEW
jgi:hypothetical protein